MNWYDRIKTMSLEEMVAELTCVAEWARNLNKKDWNNIQLSAGGVEGFIEDALIRTSSEEDYIL